MRKAFYVFVLIGLFACDSEDANDCFQKPGDIIRKEIVVANFEKIVINRNIELILKEAPEIKVFIETGVNLINDVDVLVVGNQLQVTDNNICNFVRDYASTKIYVSAPNITDIRSSTQYKISSDGVLSYNKLNLISEDFNSEGDFTIGDFRLQVKSEELKVVTNNLASFNISGVTNKLFVGFYSGAGRFEGADLIAQEVEVYHRGSNDVIVNPQQKLTGELSGMGDLISKNHPPIVTVERRYKGELIFD